MTEAGPFGVASSSSRLRGAAAADRLRPVCVRACVRCAVLEGRARCERMMHLIRCEERRKERVGGREGGGEVGFHWEGEGGGGQGGGRRQRLRSLQLSTPPTGLDLGAPRIVRAVGGRDQVRSLL